MSSKISGSKKEQLEKQKLMQEYYDDSDYFQEVETFDDLLRTPFAKYRIKNVKKMYAPNKSERILDLGCALGTFCFALADNCREIIGVDYSQKAIGIANRLLSNSPYKNIKFICSDAQYIKELESEYCDVVICADLLEHLYPQTSKNVIIECHRLLKRNGKLLIWTPHQGHILEILKNHNIILKKDISHVDYKSMNNLVKTLQESNFSILKAYYTESHIPVIRVLERFLLPILPLMRRRIAILAEKQN
jgi:2-polyprenyl-3-methyl-5-hydroxy-6-metoxy-1,4-benzoquinol methylase